MKDDPHEDPSRRIARECLAMRARRLNRVVTRIYDDALRPHDIRVTQLNILVAVAVAGSVAPAELGEMLDLEKSTLSRNVQRMIERGWLHTTDADTGRGRALTVTSEGYRLLREVWPAWDQAQQRVRKMLGDDMAAALQSSDEVLGWG